MIRPNPAFAGLSAACLALLAAAACSTAPDAPAAGNAAEGQKVAGELCASCHAIGAAGESPMPVAPPLRTVLANYDADKLAKDFENAVAIRHLEMPRFYFGENHARDVVAYLKTIQTPAS